MGFLYTKSTIVKVFLEDTIELLEEYEGQILVQERVELEYKFFFGDIVQVLIMEKSYLKSLVFEQKYGVIKRIHGKILSMNCHV